MSAELAVSKLLDQYKAQFESALPRHMRIDHFMRCALTYLKKNPGVCKCTPLSIAKSLMDAAQLGLAPDGLLGSAYLVPFKNKVKGNGGQEYWEDQCQLIPGYRGLIDLARRSGEILDIQARPVLNDDDFSLDWGKPQPLSHKPNLDANPAEMQGKNVRGVYAIAFYKDGSQHMEYMSKAEIEGIKARSKAASKGFSPWQTDWVEMARKTVVKRLAKYLPLSPELARAIELDNDANEVVREADVVAPDAKPVSKTDTLKSRLAHKPTTPIQDELDDAQRAADAAIDAAIPANGNGHAKAQETVNTQTGEVTQDTAGDDDLEADVITSNTKIFWGYVAGKPQASLWRDMSDEQRQAALDAAKSVLADPKATKAARAKNLGIVNFIEGKLTELAGNKG